MLQLIFVCGIPLLTVMVSGLALWPQPSSITWREESATYLIERVQIQEVNDAQFVSELISSRDLASTKRFVIRQFFSDSGSFCCLRGRGYHITLSMWRRGRANCLQERFVLAEVLSWRGAALLRRRSASGEVSIKMIQGADPRNFSSAIGSLAVEHFSFPRAADGRPESYIEVFAVTTKRLNPRDYPDWIEALKAIRALLPFQRVKIQLANEPLFPFEDTFPYLAPFSPASTLPLDDTLRQMSSLICRFDDSIRCD